MVKTRAWERIRENKWKVSQEKKWKNRKIKGRILRYEFISYRREKTAAGRKIKIAAD